MNVDTRCSIIVFTHEHAYTFEGDRLSMAKLHDDLKRAIVEKAPVFEAACGDSIVDIVPGCVSGMEMDMVDRKKTINTPKK